MKLFQVFINYDNGGSDEYIVAADNEEQVYDKVYADIGYDPGEVFVELLPPEDEGIT